MTKKTAFARVSWSVLFGIIPLVASYCQSVEQCPAVSQAGTETAILCLVREEIRSRLDSAEFAFDSTGFTVRIDTSFVVPGLLFAWGFYSPARDAYVSAVAAGLRDTVLVLETSADWSALLSRTAWRPRDKDEAERLCREVIATIGRWTDGVYSPLVYERPETLDRPGIGLDVSLAEIGELSPPSVRSLTDGYGWDVVLWAIDYEGAVKYQCRITSAQLVLAVRDSMKGVFLLHP